MKHRIDLAWHRDGNGYELLAALKKSALPERIRGSGGKRIAYRPLDEYPALFREFAGMKKTPEGAFHFIKKYGRLSAGDYDSVADVLSAASAMNALLKGGSGRMVEAESAVPSRLAFDATGKPTLMLMPATLLEGLWLQLAEALASGRTVGAICLCCREWFETGPGTGRRLDAKFCSDAHRIAYNSRKRSLKNNPTRRRK